MGFFSGLDTEGYDRQYSDRQLFARMTGYFNPHIRKIIVIILLLLLIALFGAALPAIVSWSLDRIQEEFTAIQVAVLGLVVLTIGVVIWGANWVRRRLTVRVVGDIVLALRVNAFQAAAGHDLSFYDRFSSGRIVSRITSDTNEFGQLVVLITDLVSQVVQALILLGLLFTIEWRLTLFSYYSCRLFSWFQLGSGGWRAPLLGEVCGRWPMSTRRLKKL